MNCPTLVDPIVSCPTRTPSQAGTCASARRARKRQLAVRYLAAAAAAGDAVQAGRLRLLTARLILSEAD